MRLIDADELCRDRVSNDLVVIVAKCAPTIDAVPVVHGEWEFVDDYTAKCSACGDCVDDDSPFCPNCGAKMDGKEHGE